MKDEGTTSMSNPEQTRANRLGRGLSALLGGMEENAPVRAEAKGAQRSLPIAAADAKPASTAPFLR